MGKCKDHPDAPHGFCRGASHSAGEYVCECEGWEPEPAAPVEQKPVAVVGVQADMHKMFNGQFFPAGKNIKVIHPLKDLPIGTSLYTHPAATISDDVLRDAERYRWLRDLDHWPACFDSHHAPEPLRGPELDAAIDAAMRESGK